MKRNSIVPWALIITGCVILLHQLDLFSFQGINLIILGSYLLGVLLLAKGLQNPNRSGILGGSFFLMTATWLLLMRINVLPVDDYLAGGLFIGTLGVANIIYFFAKPVHVSNVVIGVIFLLVALPLVYYAYGYFSEWKFEYYYSTYWPVVLILIGSGMMIDVLIKKHHQ